MILIILKWNMDIFIQFSQEDKYTYSFGEQSESISQV